MAGPGSATACIWNWCRSWFWTDCTSADGVPAVAPSVSVIWRWLQTCLQLGTNAEASSGIGSSSTTNARTNDMVGTRIFWALQQEWIKKKHHLLFLPDLLALMDPVNAQQLKRASFDLCCPDIPPRTFLGPPRQPCDNRTFSYS